MKLLLLLMLLLLVADCDSCDSSLYPGRFLAFGEGGGIDEIKPYLNTTRLYNFQDPNSRLIQPVGLLQDAAHSTQHVVSNGKFYRLVYDAKQNKMVDYRVFQRGSEIVAYPNAAYGTSGGCYLAIPGQHGEVDLYHVTSGEHINCKHLVISHPQ